MNLSRNGIIKNRPHLALSNHFWWVLGVSVKNVGQKTPVNFPKKAGLAWFGLAILWLSSRTNPSMATPKKLVEIALIMTFKICLNLFK